MDEIKENFCDIAIKHVTVFSLLFPLVSNPAASRYDKLLESPEQTGPHVAFSQIIMYLRGDGGKSERWPFSKRISRHGPNIVSVELTTMWHFTVRFNSSLGKQWTDTMWIYWHMLLLSAFPGIVFYLKQRQIERATGAHSHIQHSITIEDTSSWMMEAYERLYPLI